ncbi:MAG: DUF3127 domain-containing protein [Bacteroidetes bacterium]|uniref:DUF3127 domain-containing protein n=1 Tax=Candidatus Cryptobacteroides excrementavium TaxID=2840759 RepID=A0A9D9NRU7_9BACT|nr:DUF3127 domain-containing protein [Candidatus Cryptobacteroides excrementavium]
MALELEGKIIRKLNVQSGVSARGNWSKQEFIIEYQEGNFPSQACFNVWGEDKVKDLERFQIGDSVKVSFNISSREYNGRWYTDLRAWRLDSSGEAASAAAPAQAPAQPAAQPAQTQAPQAADSQDSQDDDDLPF